MASSGFTLLETIIAVTLFSVIVVPLVARVSVVVRHNQAQWRLTGQCILEQEACRARLYPERIVPRISRYENGYRWEIVTDAGEPPLRMVDMKIVRNGISAGRLRFLLYEQSGMESTGLAAQGVTDDR